VNVQDFILIISRCLAVRKSPKTKNYYYCFHFKGYYLGEKIRQIHLLPARQDSVEQQLTKGDDYMLWVKRNKVEDGVLEAELIAAKKII
jgi:hypothetical protein